MFKNYITVALRILIKRKQFSIINICGLAIGLACCIVILLLVRNELTFDSFHTNANRIFRLNTVITLPGKAPQNIALCMSPCGAAMLDEFPEVIGYTRFWRNGPEDEKFHVRYKERNITIAQSIYSDPSIFELFSFHLISGDAATALVEPHSVVLTQHSAQRIFGDENPLGKVIQRDGLDEFKVTGVMKNIPPTSHIQFDMLISISTSEEASTIVWGNIYTYTYLMLDKNSDAKALESKFGDFQKKHFSKFSDYFVMYLQPLRNIHLHSSNIEYDFNWKKTDITYVYIFSAIAFLILLIACINFMNISTAHSASRAKEVAMRKVVGAIRLQLIGQFICESVFISFCSMVLAVALLEISLPFLNEFFEYSFDLNYFNSGLLPLIMLGIVVVVGILAGSYPAFILSASKPVAVFKGNVNSIVRGSTLRKVMVVGQFVISIILIISSIFVGKQLSYMQNKNLGFNKDLVITIPLNKSSAEKHIEPLKNEWLQNESVTGVTASRFLMGNTLGLEGIFFEGHNSDELVTAAMNAVDYDYISFYGLELISGRDFSREFATDYNQDNTGAYIINEALQEKLGWNSALDQKFGINPNKLGTVIGVIRDFHFNSLHHKIEPLFLCIRPDQLSALSVKIKPDNIDATIESLRKTWAVHVPNQPFEFSFLDEDWAKLYKNEKLVAKTIDIFTLLAVLVSCLGLFGLISFSARKRTKEIGIRKVLGASMRNVIFLLSKEYLLMLSISIIIAWPAAWYFTNKWLEKFAYRIELDAWTFILAAIIALVIAAATVSFQAVKAATANPVDSLRYE